MSVISLILVKISHSSNRQALMIWEKVYNPDFNYGEFAIIRNHAGLNSFKISVKEFVAYREGRKNIRLSGQLLCNQRQRERTGKHRYGLFPDSG